MFLVARGGIEPPTQGFSRPLSRGEIQPARSHKGTSRHLRLEPVAFL